MTAAVNPNELGDALAEDARQFIRLHDAELDNELWLALQGSDFPDGLALGSDLASAAALKSALTLPFDGDALAADFAAIYLTGALGASPYESVWVSDDHLTAQQPMFEWRALFRADGLCVSAPRLRYDDHLVLQWQWLERRLITTPSLPASAWPPFLAVLDEHLLYWSKDWSAKVALRAATPFYAALAALSWEWLAALRQLLTDLSGLPPPPREVIASRIRDKFKNEAERVVPLKFMPGKDGPSW